MNEKIEPDRKTVRSRFIHTIQHDWCDDPDQDGLFEIRCLGENRTTVNQQFSTHAINDAIDLVAEMNCLMASTPTRRSTRSTAKLNVLAKEPRTQTSCARILALRTPMMQRGLAGLKQLAALIKPDLVVQTGSVPCKRYHAYWRLVEPCRDLSMWRQRQADIARRYGTDQAVVNPSRLMRVAGTVAYPSAAKMARGYIPELTTLKLGSS